MRQRLTFASFRSRLGKGLFGDRIGSTIFVGVLLFCGVFWQGTFVLNDTWTFANGLLAVADGQLHLERFPYGSFLGAPAEGASPGTYLVDDRVYVRSYGYLFAALPFLWCYQAAARFVEIGVLLPGLWSLLVITAGIQIDRLTDGYDWLLPVSNILAVVLFGLNVWQGTPIENARLPILALQSVTILATGLSAVFLYRFVTRVTTRRVGGFVGVVAVVATPVSFWAPIAKRHTLTVLLVVLVLYTFTRGRDAETDLQARRWRTLTYVWPGLLAWINPLEAAVLVLPLGVVDLLTARQSRRVERFVPVVALPLASIPFFITNALISGNPLLPPEALQGYLSAVQTAPPATNASTAPGVQGSDIPASALDPLALLTGDLLNAPPAVDRIVFFATRGPRTILADPWLLVQLFLRDGWPAGTTAGSTGNLAVLEGAPVLGALVAVPVVLRRYARSMLTGFRSSLASIDLLVACFVIAFGVFLFPHPPNPAQITSRYLLPIVPPLCYATVRLPAVRKVITDHWRSVVWGYTAGILIGTQMLIVLLAVFVEARAGAIQLHGLVNLGLAGAVSIWTLDATRREQGVWGRRLGGFVLGLAIAGGTAFVLLASWNHVARGEFVVPVFRVLARVIPP